MPACLPEGRAGEQCVAGFVRLISIGFCAELNVYSINPSLSDRSVVGEAVDSRFYLIVGDRSYCGEEGAFCPITERG